MTDNCLFGAARVSETEIVDNKFESFPIVGVSPQALVGHDLNIYFYNSAWVSPLYRYLNPEATIPSSTRINELPSQALTVKGYSYTRLITPYANIPRYFSLYFTSKDNRTHNSFGHQYYHYSSRLMCYLSFQDKGTWLKQDELHFGSFAQKAGISSKNRLRPSPRFTESDPDWALFPHITFTQCPGLTLQDLQSIQLGLEYILKLFQLGFNLKYDIATEKWLR